MNILITGYYHRNNLGDDLFQHVFNSWFTPSSTSIVRGDPLSTHLHVVTVDDLKNFTLPETGIQAMICGGGDLVNDYFIPKIQKFVHDHLDSRTPVFAVGIGIPYPQLIDGGYLDFFDFIIHRNSQLQQPLLDRFGPTRVHYFPDLVFSLKRFEYVMLQYELDHPQTHPHISEANDPIEVNPIDRFLDYQLGEDHATVVRKLEIRRRIATNFLGPNSHKYSKKVGIFLARPLYHPQDPDAYHQLLSDLADALLPYVKATYKLKGLVTCKPCQPSRPGTPRPPSHYKYHFYLIPNGTNTNSIREDDRIMAHDLIRKLIAKSGVACDCLPNVHPLDASLKPHEIFPVMRHLHFAISMRFHPHVFAIMAKTPVISVSASRKVQELMTDAGLDTETHPYYLKLDVDPYHHYPSHLNSTELQTKIDHLLKNRTQIQKHLKHVCNIKFTGSRTNPIWSKFDQLLGNLIWHRIRYINPDHLSNHRGFIDNLAHSKTRQVADHLVRYLLPDGFPESQITRKVGELINNQIHVKDLLSPHHLSNNEQLAEMVSFILTRERITDYNWGISTQILNSDYDLPAAIKWILVEEIKKAEEPKNKLQWLHNSSCWTDRKLNLKFIQQHEQCGVHRSGWKYVMDHLTQLHGGTWCDQFQTGSSHPLSHPHFDSYLDKTFGWCREFYKTLNVLPFTQPWTGVFHHTPNTEYSNNNLIEAINNPEFINSLPHCKGLIVLSEDLRLWLINALELLQSPEHPDLPTITVVSLTHPTEIPSTQSLFDLQKFNANQEKKVIQIGAWLRNTYSIYSLPTPPNFQKVALKGLHMDNYYPQSESIPLIHNVLLQLGKLEIEPECEDGEHPISRDDSPQLMCRDWTHGNKFFWGLSRLITQHHSSVQLIEHQSNQDYDDLLTQNIVYIDLISASACNTLIECIVRHTPILINANIPSVIEYLGPDYPLYYTSQQEAYQKLNCPTTILLAHLYLKNLPKAKFTINHFLKTLTKSLIFQRI